MALASASLAAEPTPSSRPATQPSSRPGSAPAENITKARVAHLRAIEVVEQPNLLREMVEDAVKIITETATPAEAWNRLFRQDDVIGIKFNQVGFEELGTTQAMAAQLVDTLGRAGFAPQRIVLIEAPARLTRQLKTRPCAFGWSGGKVSFGSGAEELAAVLQDVTALLNVPFLKTHNIAGLTGCLKNLSHALIRSPAKYHGNACTPYVGDIVALPSIRSKLRLNIINALRAVFAGGPLVRSENRWTHGGIIVSTDPVAADAVGVDIINQQRELAGLAPIGNAQAQIPHVHHAAAKGLGADDPDFIELIEPEHVF